MSEPENGQATPLDAAPARFLDQFEELRMDLSDEQLIAEAIEINHSGVGKQKTLDRYQDHLVHFSQYLASAQGKTGACGQADSRRARVSARGGNETAPR
jgi:hypothetical protein